MLVDKVSMLCKRTNLLIFTLMRYFVVAARIMGADVDKLIGFKMGSFEYLNI